MTTTTAVNTSATRPVTPRAAPKRSGMPHRARKWVVSVHVLSSVAWLGLTVGMLVFGAAALTTSDASVQYACFTAMKLLADTVLLPVAIAALVSGIVLGLGTKWGLFRYWWVTVKFVLTTVAFTATIFAFRPNVHSAAAVADPDALATEGIDSGLVAAPIVSLSLYVFATVLSYVKPWGKIRKRASAHSPR